MGRPRNTQERCQQLAIGAANLWLAGQRIPVSRWISGSQLKLLYVYRALSELNYHESHLFMLHMLRSRANFNLVRDTLSLDHANPPATHDNTKDN